MELKTVLITQARTGSTRLPGKVLMEINQKPLLKIHLDRLRKSKNLNKIIVATTVNPEDNIIEKLVGEWGYEVYRGSENDVLDRFYQAVKNLNPHWVVRVTSDCPLIDPDLLDEIIAFAQQTNFDYCSNTLIENFPDGQCIEVFKFSALKIAWEEAILKSEREHVTPFIIKMSSFNNEKLFTSVNFANDGKYSHVRMTIDESRDFELLEKVICNQGTEKTWEEYAEYIVSNGLESLNKAIQRNEGYLKSIKND